MDDVGVEHDEVTDVEAALVDLLVGDEEGEAETDGDDEGLGGVEDDEAALHFDGFVFVGLECDAESLHFVIFGVEVFDSLKIQ